MVTPYGSSECRPVFLDLWPRGDGKGRGDAAMMTTEGSETEVNAAKQGYSEMKDAEPAVASCCGHGSCHVAGLAVAAVHLHGQAARESRRVSTLGASAPLTHPGHQHAESDTTLLASMSSHRHHSSWLQSSAEDETPKGRWRRRQKTQHAPLSRTLVSLMLTSSLHPCAPPLPSPICPMSASAFRPRATLCPQSSCTSLHQSTRPNAGRRRCRQHRLLLPSSSTPPAC